MRAMSEAIEGARDFRDMIEKIEAGAAQQANALRMQQAATRGATPDAHGFPVWQGSDRLPGENRAAHRARLKAERRAGKVKA